MFFFYRNVKYIESIVNTVSFLVYITRTRLVLEVPRRLSYFFVLTLGAYLSAYTFSYIVDDSTIITHLAQERLPRTPNQVDVTNRSLLFILSYLQVIIVLTGYYYLLYYIYRLLLFIAYCIYKLVLITIYCIYRCNIEHIENIVNTVSFLTYIIRSGLALEVPRRLSYFFVLTLGAYLCAYIFPYIVDGSTIIIHLAQERLPRTPNRVDVTNRSLLFILSYLQVIIVLTSYYYLLYYIYRLLLFIGYCTYRLVLIIVYYIYRLVLITVYYIYAYRL